MLNEASSCDPSVEVCEVAKVAETEPDIMPTIYLGVIALLKALVPAILRFYVADSNISMTKSSIYPTAWTLLCVGNAIMWGILSIMWPLSYLVDAIVNFYLLLTQYGGVYAGAVLALVHIVLFLVGYL